MSDASDGELKFESRDELEAWLKTQPREVSVVIAARAALHLLPRLRFGDARAEAEPVSQLIFACFRAAAMARVAAKYPMRASELRAADAAVGAADAADGFSSPTVLAAVGYAAADAAAASYAATTEAAAADASAAADDASAAAADAYRHLWDAVSDDANRLNSVGPANLAGEPLWEGHPPAWSWRDWRALQEFLKERHWKPWLDWYQRRLDGYEAAEDIELLFATLPVDPRQKKTAEQNAALAAEIERLSKSELDGIPDGELNFFHPRELEAWLKTQPREVSVVIASRAALRIMPTLQSRVARLEAQEFVRVIFASFWAAAVARAAARYPARAKELPAPAALAASADHHNVAAAVDASAHAARAVYARNFDNAAAAAAACAPIPSAMADIWAAVSADANRLKDVAPSDLASEPLWPRGIPLWALQNVSKLIDALNAPHWKPWLDWFERRSEGREDREEIELLFATLPVDPREKEPAEQNAALAAEIARLSNSRASTRDFFISYSGQDEGHAREIASVLEAAGHSTFAQFNDIAPGHNFVREMQRGLEASRSLVAVVSPDYEASDHCQAEWAFAYNRDAGGARRKIVPFLLRETKLNALASQVVYKSLIGLAGEARRQAILAAIAPQPLPPPLENLSAPFTFGWSTAHRVAIVAGRSTSRFSRTLAATGITVTVSTPAARRRRGSRRIWPRKNSTCVAPIRTRSNAISKNCPRRPAKAIF